MLNEAETTAPETTIEAPATQQTEATTPAGTPTGGLLNDDMSDKAALKAAPINYPETWREDYAKGNDKVLSQLKRFASPQAAIDSYFELQKKFSAGEHKKTVALSENPTEEELKVYRKENNIPEKPSDYKIELGNGYQIGNADKPIVDNFLTQMHAANMPSATVNKVLNTYYEIQNDLAAEKIEEYTRHKEEAALELMQEYGATYKKNINIVNNFLKNKFGDDYEAIANAVGGDGKPIASNPSLIRKFLAMATEIDPISTLALPDSSRNQKGVEDRITEIEKYMGTNRNDYYKDQSLQKEYNELLQVKLSFNKS